MPGETSVARLIRVPLDATSTPHELLRALAHEPWPFALVGSWAGGGALVGASPLRVAKPGEDPFALLEQVPAMAAGTEPSDADAVGGGWFGWLGYGLAARVERLPPPPPRPVPLPPFQLAYYDHVLRLDAEGSWWFEALATPPREAALEARLTQLRALLATATTAPPDDPPGLLFRLTGAGAQGHLAAVQACRERIAAGEIFQANVCLRLEADWRGDVAQLFARACTSVEPAYGAAFPAPWGGVASLSPELFLRRRGREVSTAPIKGTVARHGNGPVADAARAALSGSAKDAAEHVMIVDLMRNDLGRVCAYGSIAAAPAPTAEPHPGVWHLVSRVQGRLRADAGDGALVRAAFPPGSVTGAPKVQAMHVIAALEATARELYTGAIGFASPLAGLELSVAIRTFEARDGRLWLGAGGGIVADSDPAGELEECLVKARPLIAAIGGRIEAAAEREPDVHAAPPSAPAALAPDRRRPDPMLGVFETLLVDEGEAVRAPAHLARLAASVAALYGGALPPDLPERVATAVAELDERSALRIVAEPQRDGHLAITLEARELRTRELPVVLTPVTLPGGLGAHKWRDRRLLEALTRDGTTPLLLDGDGSVLEAAWANVFALEGELLITPPADGRLLPGITRAALLDAAELAGLHPVEQQLPLARLAAADAIVLSSALAGAVLGRLGDGPAQLGVRPSVRRLTELLARSSLEQLP